MADLLMHGRPVIIFLGGYKNREKGRHNNPGMGAGAEGNGIALRGRLQLYLSNKTKYEGSCIYNRDVRRGT